MSWNNDTDIELGAARQELMELLRVPFETDEWRDAMLRAEARKVQLLEQIAANTGALPDQDLSWGGDPSQSPDDQPYSPGGGSDGGGGGGGGISLSSFSVAETSQMEFANASGTVTVNPGETATLVRATAQGEQQRVLAVGATDRDLTAYTLVSDDTEEFTTFSPLGLVNSPFSFLRTLGFTYPAGHTVEYQVTVSEGATEARDYAARLMVGEE